MSPFTLQDFLDQSNLIEGMGPAESVLVAEAERFLALRAIEASDIESFVKVAQPDAVLRDRGHLNVCVGNHVAPRGGMSVVYALYDILRDANAGLATHPFLVHQAYEALHPFTDGNGRSGRILWLWMMGGIERAPLGFLHHWYYQSLELWRSAP